MTLEYRRLFAKASFDSVSDDPVEMGGDALLAGFSQALEALLRRCLPTSSP